MVARDENGGAAPVRRHRALTNPVLPHDVGNADAASLSGDTRAASRRHRVELILIGEGDLSQELGCPREYDNACVLDALKQVVATCKEHKVPVGHPHVDSNNVERILSEGYSFLVAAPVRSYGALDKGRQLAGRK